MKSFVQTLGLNKGDHALRDELPHALAALLVTQLIGSVEGCRLELALIERRASLAQVEILVLVITAYGTITAARSSGTSRISLQHLIKPNRDVQRQLFFPFGIDTRAVADGEPKITLLAGLQLEQRVAQSEGEYCLNTSSRKKRKQMYQRHLGVTEGDQGVQQPLLLFYWKRPKLSTVLNETVVGIALLWHMD